MIDYKTSKGARILFVGINPHPGSDRRGVPFSNNKMFWYLLNRAGLLQESVSDLKDDRTLKEIYDTRFVEKYNLNFVNLVDRPTVDVTLLKKGEEQPGIHRLREIIRTCEPRVVCFIGKIAFHIFHGIRRSDWGWQPEILGTKVYLMHFPIRGPAEVRVNDLKEISGPSQPARTATLSGHHTKRKQSPSRAPTTSRRASGRTTRDVEQTEQTGIRRNPSDRILTK